MYLITTYGNWNYECFAYDLDSVPKEEWIEAIKWLVDESGEDILTVHESLDGSGEDEDGHKDPDKIFTWEKGKWQEELNND